MLRTALLAAVFAAIVATAQFAPTPAAGQTVPPAKDCTCEVIDWPEPGPCPRIFLPHVSR